MARSLRALTTICILLYSLFATAQHAVLEEVHPRDRGVVHRLRGHAGMPTLVTALRAHDAKLDGATMEVDAVTKVA